MIKVTNIGYDLTEFNYTSDIHLDSIENSLDNMGEVINSLTSNVQKTDTLIIMVEEKSTAVSQPTKNPKIKQIIENLDETLEECHIFARISDIVEDCLNISTEDHLIPFKEMYLLVYQIRLKLHYLNNKDELDKNRELVNFVDKNIDLIQTEMILAKDLLYILLDLHLISAPKSQFSDDSLRKHIESFRGLKFYLIRKLINKNSVSVKINNTSAPDNLEYLRDKLVDISIDLDILLSDIYPDGVPTKEDTKNLEYGRMMWTLE